MRTLRMIIGALLLGAMAITVMGCSGKIGQPFTDCSWQKPPPGTGGGK